MRVFQEEFMLLNLKVLETALGKGRCPVAQFSLIILV